MSMPTEDFFAAVAADRGLNLSSATVHTAVAMHAKFRHELDTLRAVRLAFLPPYIEPETALRWIENGGHL
jgi:hypothetical protein